MAVDKRVFIVHLVRDIFRRRPFSVGLDKSDHLRDQTLSADTFRATLNTYLFATYSALETSWAMRYEKCTTWLDLITCCLAHVWSFLANMYLVTSAITFRKVCNSWHDLQGQSRSSVIDRWHMTSSQSSTVTMSLFYTVPLSMYCHPFTNNCMTANDLEPSLSSNTPVETVAHVWRSL